MATSQYLPFATGVGANTLSFATYSTGSQFASLVSSGNLPGVALSAFVNTTLRQVTVGVAGVASFATTYGTADCLDDGSPINFREALKNAIDAIINSNQFWKPGDLKSTINPTVPAGWLKANGQMVSRATYPALFAAIGLTYNPGAPGDVFQLPDWRGDFMRGWDDGRGVDADRALGSNQSESVGAHTHYLHTQTRNVGDADGATGTHISIGVPPTGNAVGGQTGGIFTLAENRPRNRAAMILIKT